MLLQDVVDGHPFVPATPHPLRAARTCYNHIAGALGVSRNDRFLARGWLVGTAAGGSECDLTPAGREPSKGWESTAHLGGALGAALLEVALERRWVTRDFDSRALSVTPTGRREMRTRFGLTVADGWWVSRSTSPRSIWLRPKPDGLSISDRRGPRLAPESWTPRPSFSSASGSRLFNPSRNC